MRFEVGQQIPIRTVQVSGEAMKPMALVLRDPNPIHWDVEVLRALGMDERPVNQGPTNVAYVWNMLTEWLGDAAAVSSVSVRFVSNALAGELLTAGGAVTAVDDPRGVTCDVWLERPGGERVVAGQAVIDPAR